MYYYHYALIASFKIIYCLLFITQYLFKFHVKLLVKNAITNDSIILTWLCNSF